jgi:hypothetical protein
MTSDNIEAANPDVQDELAAETRLENGDRLSKLWALFPTADQLRSMEAGVSLVTSDRHEVTDRNQPSSLDVPRALLNPLQLLPRPLSINEVKGQRHADGPARTTRADSAPKARHPGKAS